MCDCDGKVATIIIVECLLKAFTIFVFAIVTVKVIEGTIYLMSKGGKQKISDTGLRGLTDSQLESLYKSPDISKSEKQRLKKEQKARKLRNKSKRNSN